MSDKADAALEILVGRRPASDVQAGGDRPAEESNARWFARRVAAAGFARALCDGTRCFRSGRIRTRSQRHNGDGAGDPARRHREALQELLHARKRRTDSGREISRSSKARLTRRNSLATGRTIEPRRRKRALRADDAIGNRRTSSSICRKRARRRSLWRKPAIKRNSPDYYAGMVANAALGTGFVSRLNREIRIKRGLSYGARSAIDARRDGGPFRRFGANEE